MPNHTNGEDGSAVAHDVGELQRRSQDIELEQNRLCDRVTRLETNQTIHEQGTVQKHELMNYRIAQLEEAQNARSKRIWEIIILLLGWALTSGFLIRELTNAKH